MFYCRIAFSYSFTRFIYSAGFCTVFVSYLFLYFDYSFYFCGIKKTTKGSTMARVKKPSKIKEPIRLRMKLLNNGSKSLYLDIYRNGKRSYEYLKMYIIPEVDDNARKQNIVTMTAANAIKSKRIIEMTNGEAGIKMPDEKPKMLLSEWMQQYMANQESKGKKGLHQIKVAMQILKDYAGEQVTIEDVDKTFCKGYIDYLLTEYQPQGRPISRRRIIIGC